MRNPLRSVFFLLLASTLPAIACAADQPIPDKELGLSKQSVFDTPQPKAYEYMDKMPGGTPLLSRGYVGAPPQIPHRIEDFLPVGKQRNMCLTCHKRPQSEKRGKGQPTPIPASHYTDLRHSPDKAGKDIVGARYICTQCHVPQANTGVLVGNDFSD